MDLTSHVVVTEEMNAIKITEVIELIVVERETDVGTITKEVITEKKRGDAVTQKIGVLVLSQNEKKAVHVMNQTV